jgi:hypothetical protein
MSRSRLFGAQLDWLECFFNPIDSAQTWLDLAKPVEVVFQRRTIAFCATGAGESGPIMQDPSVTGSRYCLLDVRAFESGW